MRLSLIALTIALLAARPPAAADDLVWITGRVFASDSRAPLKDATVAVYDDKNRVVDYAKTDSEGIYTLAVQRNVLRLDKKTAGFFHRVAGGVSRLVGGISGPLRMGIKAATSAVPAAGIAAQAGVGIASGVAQNLVASIRPNGAKANTNAPGSVVMKVTLPGRNDAVALAGVYWMQEETFKAGRREQRILSAWMDPVSLTPAESRDPSVISSPFMLFTDARLEPSIAEPGQSVILSATIPSPPEPRTPITVIARNNKTGEITLLAPTSDGRYRGEITVDRKAPRHDQIITILAYAEQSDQPGRSKGVETAILRSGLFNAEKPFVYNPLLVVSRNRGEVTLTVVEPPRKKK